MVDQGRVRCALFVDFDNMFTGLLRLDRSAALDFAERPGDWLSRLTSYGLAGAQRDALVRRVYLNPQGSVEDREPGNDARRLYLSRFRPNWTSAGFEVVDCPPLTAAQKNAADIRIVLDVITALDGTTRYDEFLIASSDSDFTPLLQRLRAADRRAVIMSTGSTSPAYLSVAHQVIDGADVVSLVTGAGLDDDEPDTGRPAETTSTLSADGRDTASVAQSEYGVDAVAEARARAEAAILAVLASAAQPVYLSQLGNHVRAAVDAQILKVTNYFGTGNLRELCREVADGALFVDGTFVWDPSRHTAPAVEPGRKPLPALIERVCQVTDLPRLATSTWPEVIDTLLEYAATHDVKAVEGSAWVRDRLAERDIAVGRGHISSVMRALATGDASLTSAPLPNREECFEAVVESTRDRAAATGWALTSDELAALHNWIEGAGEATLAAAGT